MGYRIKVTTDDGEEYTSANEYTKEEAEEMVESDFENRDLGWLGDKEIVWEEVVED